MLFSCLNFFSFSKLLYYTIYIHTKNRYQKRQSKKNVKSKKKMSTNKVETPGIVNGTTGLAGSVLSGFGSVLAFVSVIAGVLGIVVSALPFIIVTAVVTTIMVPFVNNADTVVELGEFSLRSTVFPIFRDTIREWVNLIRFFYNPLICYWNAVNWWFFGLYREALFPTLSECGIGTVFVNFGSFALAFANNFIRYFLTFSWINGDELDFTDICAKWIIFAESWIDLIGCSCFDLADFLIVMPAFLTYLPISGIQYLPIPMINPFSAQWADPQYCLFWANLFNSIMAVVGEFIRLLFAIFNAIFYGPPDPFPRPDLRRAGDLLSASNSAFRRSLENVYQRIWDKFIPFLDFKFERFLCYMDTIFELLVVGGVNALNILVNIDRVVQYPNDPYYEEVVRKDFEQWVNLIGEPTVFDNFAIPRPPDSPRFILSSYYIDTNAETLPDNTRNPIFGRIRLTECFCIFVERLICDQQGNGLACFSSTFQQILQGFDFCCFFEVAGKGIADILAGAFELTIFISQGSDSFFLFVDDMPYITLLKENLVEAVRCLLSFFTLIPEIGECIRDLLVSAVDWILCMADFLIKVILGLGTLPYFLVELPGIPNFVTRMDEAIDAFVEINNQLIGMTEGTFIYCLSLLVNTGFPIPPIPCSSCETQVFPGVASPIQIFKKHNDGGRIMQSPMDIVASVFGASQFTKRVTPLRFYRNRTWNPWILSGKIAKNAKVLFERDLLPFSSVKQVDKFVDMEKQALLDRWELNQQCNDLDAESRRVKQDNFKLWVYKLKRNQWSLPDGKECPPKEERTWMPREKHIPPQTKGYVQAQRPRLTIGPTDPPLSSCDPRPPCFDLSCILRTTLNFLVHLLNFIGRFLNGLIQGAFETDPPTSDFRYFTGESATVLGKPSFEEDLVTAVILLVAPLQCICEALNLVIPVTDFNPREDICCAIQRVGELVACILQVIISSISALALGAQDDFAYFRNNGFYEDVSTLFDITIELVDCLCVLIRALFPLSYIPGFDEATNFDICCIPRSLVVTIIELARLLLQMIISLATITVSQDSICYYRLDVSKGCPGTLEEIGLVKQIDTVLATLFTSRDAQCDRFCNQDHGRGGLAPCICQIVNSLLPARNDPGSPINCDPTEGTLNCQEYDFCCPVVKIAIAANDLGMFLNRLLVSVWQPWAQGDNINNCRVSYPVYFVNFLFCRDPETFVPVIPSCSGSLRDCGVSLPDACSDGDFSATGGEFQCGALKPFINILIDEFDGLLTHCVCEYVKIIDLLLSDQFIGLGNWSAEDGCFCGRTNGILRKIGLLAKTIVNAVVVVIREFPLPCFWAPCNVNPGQFDVESSFIFNWLGPVADATCIASSTFGCFVQNLFFLPDTCAEQARRLFAGLTRWIWQALFVLVNIFEGFIRQFADEPSNCVGDTCGEWGGSAEIGGVVIQGEPLGAVLSALLTFPIDALFGDSNVACSTICNPRYIGYSLVGDLTSGALCSCYSGTTIGRESWYRNQPTTNLYTWEFAPGFFLLNVDRACFGTRDLDGDFIPDIDERPLCSEPVCIDQRLCRPDDLPTCGSHPNTNVESLGDGLLFRSVDGVLISFIRYISCITRALIGSGFASFFTPVIQIMSIIWQIWGGVARFIVAVIMFALSLFGLSFGFFTAIPSLITIASRFIGVLNAFVDIFRQPLIIPTAKRDIKDPNNRESNFVGPVNRESFHEFKARANHIVPGGGPNLLNVTLHALYDYDVDDCFDDVSACICRNMPMEDHCHWTREQGTVFKKDVLTTQQVLQHLKAMFPGSSMCDHVIQDCADAHPDWSSVPFAVKAEFSQCMDTRIRGERMHHLMPEIMPDFFYRDRAKIDLFNHALNNAKRIVRQEQLDAAMQKAGYEDPQRFKEHMDQRKQEAQEFKKKLQQFDKSIMERRDYITKRMISTYKYDQTSEGFEVVRKLDELWFKMHSGYFGHIMYRAGVKMQRGETSLIPSPEVAWANVKKSAADMFNTIDKNGGGKTILQNSLKSIEIARKVASKVYTKGIKGVRDLVTTPRWTERETMTPNMKKRREYLKRERAKWFKMWNASPLKIAYDYYFGAARGSERNTPIDQRWFGQFRDHINRTITYARTHDDAPLSLWNVGQRWSRAKKEVKQTFWKPHWTPEKERNWAKLQAFGYKVYDTIWPNSLPRDVQERFIFGCNCILADRLLDTTGMLVDYCVNEFEPNLDVEKYGDTKRSIRTFLNATSGHRKRGFYRHGYRDSFHHPKPDDPDAWIRPKKIMPPRASRTLYDRQVYKRATSGGARIGVFNLLDWIVCVVSDLFGDDLSQRVDMIIEDIVEFVENDTLDVADYPNVGLAYWLSFFVRCEWPEYLNCSLGSGLEDGIVTGAITWLVLLVFSLIIPGPGGALLAIGSFAIWIIVVPIISWHYSPQCWLLTPSFPLGFGWNIPIWPFPIAFPTLPECLADEIIALLDKYITGKIFLFLFFFVSHSLQIATIFSCLITWSMAMCVQQTPIK